MLNNILLTEQEYECMCCGKKIPKDTVTKFMDDTPMCDVCGALFDAAYYGRWLDLMLLNIDIDEELTLEKLCPSIENLVKCEKCGETKEFEFVSYNRETQLLTERCKKCGELVEKVLTAKYINEVLDSNVLKTNNQEEIEEHEESKAALAEDIANGNIRYHELMLPSGFKYFTEKEIADIDEDDPLYPLLHRPKKCVVLGEDCDIDAAINEIKNGFVLEIQVEKEEYLDKIPDIDEAGEIYISEYNELYIDDESAVVRCAYSPCNAFANTPSEKIIRTLVKQALGNCYCWQKVLSMPVGTEDKFVETVKALVKKCFTMDMSCLETGVVDFTQEKALKGKTVVLPVGPLKDEEINNGYMKLIIETFANHALGIQLHCVNEISNNIYGRYSHPVVKTTLDFGNDIDYGNAIYDNDTVKLYVNETGINTYYNLLRINLFYLTEQLTVICDAEKKMYNKNYDSEWAERYKFSGNEKIAELKRYLHNVMDNVLDNIKNIENDFGVQLLRNVKRCFDTGFEDNVDYESFCDDTIEMLEVYSEMEFTNYFGEKTGAEISVWGNVQNHVVDNDEY